MFRLHAWLDHASERRWVRTLALALVAAAIVLAALQGDASPALVAAVCCLVAGLVAPAAIRRLAALAGLGSTRPRPGSSAPPCTPSSRRAPAPAAAGFLAGRSPLLA